MEFNPDRFMSREGSPPETDPRNFSFGFGRRCVAWLIVMILNWKNYRACPGTFSLLFDLTKIISNGI